MNKKYIVRLSGKERGLLLEIVKKLKGTSQKVRRANILLKADASQDNWPDFKIAEALSCRVKTVENIRRRFVMEGFDEVLNTTARHGYGLTPYYVPPAIRGLSPCPVLHCWSGAVGGAEAMQDAANSAGVLYPRLLCGRW